MAKSNQPKPKGKPTKKGKISQQVKDWLAPIDTFITTHSRKVAGLIFIVSLGLSAIYYFEGHNSPIKSLYKWENSDMAFFDTWAKHIVAGDWLCDTMLHPYHDWHGMVATSYFKQYPEVAAKYYPEHTINGALDTIAARKALINDIYKGKTYHQEPLYAYLLAITIKLFGHNYDWVFFWQFLLGALTNVLVFLVGKRFFGAVTGLLAALFVMFSGAILVFEMVLLRTTMTNFFTLLLLYLYLLVLEKPNWKMQLAFGAASGIALLGQSYLIVFIFPALLWFAWQNRKNMKETGITISAYLAALLLVMSPLFYRNIKVGVPFNALASHGAMAYIPVNTRNSAPMESFSIFVPELVKIRHDSEGKLIPAAIQCLETFHGISDFWRIYKQKINGMFMWFEMPNNMSYYMYREFAPILGQLPIRYFFIAPFGIAGFLLAWWRYRKKFMPFILITLACMVPLFVAGNLARYRTPLEMILSLTAAYLIIELMYMVIHKNWKAFVGWTGLSILSLIYTSNIVSKGLFVINPNDLMSMYGNHYLDRLIALEDEGKNQEYYQLYTNLMGYIPDYFFTTKVSEPIYFANEADCCNYVAQLMSVYVKTLQLFNDRQKDITYYNDRITVLKAKADNYYSSRKK
jgi:4-amino-4-deoxy-L-arabinose transferase-like glycosyltransferase